MAHNFFSSGGGYILFLWAVFLIMLWQILCHYSFFLALFKKLNKKAILFLFSISIFGLFLRCAVIPHMHHVYYDEFHYAHIAQNMYYHNIIGHILKGDKLHPEIVSMRDIRPGGYSFLLNVAFGLFGESEGLPFYLNSFLGAATISLIFFIAYLLFSNINVAFWSAFVFNFLPLHLKYSGCGASDISSLFFVMLAVFTAILYLKQNKISLLYLLASTVVFASYIRPENSLLFLLYTILIFRQLKREGLQKSELCYLFVPTLIFLLPLILQIKPMLSLENNSARGSFWSLNYFFLFLFDNIKYIFSLKYNFFFAGIFFLFGSIVLFIRQRKLFYLLMGWFCLFFFLYSCFFVGDFLPDKTVDAERHFLLSGISFSIFAGFGISIFLYYFRKKRLALVISTCVISAFFILNSYFVLKRLINITLNREVFKEYEFVRHSMNKLPENLYILDFDSEYIISAFNRKTISLDMFLEDKDFPQQLILFKGLCWHTFTDKSGQYESSLKDIYDFNPFVEVKINSRANYSFEILTKKGG